MSTIPWTEIALGSARQIGLAEGVSIGLSAGKLFQSELDDAKLAGASRSGWMARNFERREQGFTLFDPDNGGLPQSVSLAEAIKRLKTHTGNPEQVLSALKIDADSEEESIKRGNKNPQQWFDARVKTFKIEPGSGVEKESYQTTIDDEVNGGTIISGTALSFTSPSGARLFFTRGSSEKRIVSEPIQGRLKPIVRSPYTPTQSTTYLRGRTTPVPLLGSPLLSLFTNPDSAPEAVDTTLVDYMDSGSSSEGEDNLTGIAPALFVPPNNRREAWPDTQPKLPAARKRPIRINAGVRTSEKFADSVHST
jgi:hypothetical protein